MRWNFVSDRPIYAQIVESMKLFIAGGELAPGGKVPPVRDLAAEAGVNPNTMQRALAELEREGLLRSNRTSGRYVTDDAAVVETVRLSLAKAETVRFLGAMEKLGYGRADIARLIENFKAVDDKA